MPPECGGHQLLTPGYLSPLARPFHGNPTLRIIEQEQEWDCDLIVMGKHGVNLLEALLIGSVTKQVLAESMGDVLVSV